MYELLEIDDDKICKEILKEIKKLLVWKDTLESDCISLYDIILVYKKMNAEYELMKKTNFRKLKSAFNSKCRCVSIEWLSFDYERYKLIVDVENFGVVNFNKQSGKICVIYDRINEDEISENKINEIFVSLYGEISRIYDEYISYERFIKQFGVFFKTCNMDNFEVMINPFKICMYEKYSWQYCREFFEIDYFYRDNKYEYKNSEIMNIIKDNEKKILKKVFVKNRKLPEMVQERII